MQGSGQLGKVLPILVITRAKRGMDSDSQEGGGSCRSLLAGGLVQTPDIKGMLHLGINR